MLKVYIDGNEVPYTTFADSISIEDAIEERAMMTCVVIDKDNEYTFLKGQPVEVCNDETLEFSGVIDIPQKKKVHNGEMLHTLQCIDWHYLADKRIIAKAYEDTLAGDIVQDIVDEILVDEDVTVGTIQNGPVVNEAVFNYVRVSDALDALAEKAGFWWMIDETKQIHFVSRSTYSAPFSVTNTDMAKDSISVEQGNTQYRNRQYIKGGKDITDPQTQTFKGDGENQSFVVGYPIAKVPTITLNSNPQTVGIRGLDEDKDWYWSKGSNVISQEDEDTPINSTDILSITYQGEFDIVVLTQDLESINTRQTIEGAGTGYVENVEDDVNINSREAAFELANAKLEKYSQIGRLVKFRTWKSGLAPGQLLSVNLLGYGINTDLLIDAVTISTENRGQQVWYNIQAVEGPTHGSWAKLFYHMATRGQAFVIRENIQEDQILVTVSQFYKTWLEIDSPNIFAVVHPGVGLKPGFKPMFAIPDRVKYIAWYNGVTELGRKAITQQTGIDTDEIFSLTFLAPYEANEEITHIGWWGGWQASEDTDTGVEVDKQEYDKIKTSLEAIQIEKTDTKGEW
jgi:hypothetical protein